MTPLHRWRAYFAAASIIAVILLVILLGETTLSNVAQGVGVLNIGRTLDKITRLREAATENSTNIAVLSPHGQGSYQEAQLMTNCTSAAPPTLQKSTQEAPATPLKAETAPLPTILLWVPPYYYSKLYGMGKTNPVYATMSEECGGCQYTNDRHTLSRADVVVFHDRLVVGKGDFPRRYRRKANQKYVFWTRENPYHSRWLRPKVELKQFDSVFNLTMTYRSDSDIQLSYGCLADLQRHWENKVEEPLANKTKVAIMIASDCSRLGAKQRKKYSDLLIKAGLKLDRFGKCFGGRFETDLETMLKPYKFFMSFENALHCREYITEKFWKNALTYGLVPVVWGTAKKDVKTVAPNGSFIHVEDFENAKELTEYLEYLDSNDTAYEEYFRWRYSTNEEADDSRCTEPSIPPIPFGFCELCRKIRTDTRPRVIPSITDWWYGTDSPECLATELSKDILKSIKRLIH